MSSTPHEGVVEDFEILARRCDRKRVRKDKTVKWQAFARTTMPFEVSVVRAGMRDPWETIADEERRRRTLVGLVAGQVREVDDDVDVVASPTDDEPAHAHIGLEFAEAPAEDVETKAQVEELGLWDRYVQLLTKLATIARPFEDMTAHISGASGLSAPPEDAG